MILKDSDYNIGFMHGYWGEEFADDASEEYKRGYGIGYETSERESARAGETV